MQQIEIDGDATARFCAAAAQMFAVIHAAQTPAIQEALAAVLAEGADLLIEIGTMSGSFTASVDIRGQRTVVLEACLRPGKTLGS